ncbi:MAG: thiamine biosynthesis protein ThiS [Gammaproteobacteria bacterium]|nr:thiamine biosynthesis protein ThiS [Gammaproteobacteria bacterium]|tara:strand:+ start:167 stop:367 length:201 start_codon:yes stop_codon:yes gene_type:complete
MNVYVNQKLTIVSNDTSLDKFIESLAISDKYFAVEINMVIIPKSEFSKYILQENDKIELINAVGGG